MENQIFKETQSIFFFGDISQDSSSLGDFYTVITDIPWHNISRNSVLIFSMKFYCYFLSLTFIYVTFVGFTRM